MSEGWSRKHIVSGDHFHVQRREGVGPRRTEGCGGGGIAFPLGGERPHNSKKREKKVSQNMRVGMRKRR